MRKGAGSRFCLALILSSLLAQPELTARPAGGHVVDLQELQSELSEHSARRLQSIQEIKRLLSQGLVQEQVGKLVELDRISVALSTLDDETLLRLADESRSLNTQLRAGLSRAWIIGIVAAVLALAAILIVTSTGGSGGG